MIDLNALAAFVSVVDAGSFTAGAQASGLPKGSVSRKISSLEAELGVRLLHRTTRKLSLTEIGRTYYSLCRSGLSEIELANRLVNQSQSVPGGVLRISAPADSGISKLGEWVAAYLQKYEDTKVELVLSDQYVDMIEQRIDLAIRSGRLRDSSFVARKLAATHRILCASPEYLADRGIPSLLADLEHHDCIIHGHSVTGATWILEGPEGEISVPVPGRIAGHSMGLVLDLACAGLGIALVPHSVAAGEIAANRLVHVLTSHGGPEQGLYAIYPSQRQMSVNVRAFLDLVVEQIGLPSGLK